MEVLKSSRFWMSVVVCICVSVFVALGKYGAESAIALMLGLLSGFSIGKMRKIGEVPVTIQAVAVQSSVTPLKELIAAEAEEDKEEKEETKPE